MNRLTVSTLDLLKGDVLVPRPRSGDCDGDEVQEIMHPAHSQLHNAAVVRYRRGAEMKEFLAGIDVKHEIERP